MTWVGNAPTFCHQLDKISSLVVILWSQDKDKLVLQQMVTRDWNDIDL